MENELQKVAELLVAKSDLRLTLPARYYTDAQTFQDEMERFFFGGWIYAGRATEIAHPGEYFVCEVVDESVIVIRNDKGALSAFYNVCRHRGTRLCDKAQGKFSGGIQCPYHAWTFGYDGRLKAAPGMSEVAGFSASEFPLHKVAVAEWEGNIFLNLSNAPAKFEDYLGDLSQKFRNWRMEDLRLGKRLHYSLKANWKLILQNYSECLHCPVIHPALAKLSPYLSGDNEPSRPNYLGGSMILKENVSSMTMDGTTKRAPFKTLTATERRHVYYYSVLPNLLLSLHPDYMMTHTLWPRAADRTDVICEFHFLPEEMERPDFDSSDAVEFWDLTNRQDWHVSELSQLGISSRAYTPGPYSHRESLLWGLDELVGGRESTPGEA